MIPFIVVALICVGITLSTIVRMRRAASVPALFWLVLLFSLANPLVIGWMVNFPEKEDATVSLKKEDDSVRLFVPEDYSLLVTAIPSSFNGSLFCKVRPNVGLREDRRQSKFLCCFHWLEPVNLFVCH